MIIHIELLTDNWLTNWRSIDKHRFIYVYLHTLINWCIYIYIHNESGYIIVQLLHNKESTSLLRLSVV